ncbi:hypothetical protein BGX38DRAFT_1183781 [Terfezia claveryi]|nr:hypothetical protein BGX38DRAFT_1183781 [Terfezia claveryi]
MNVISDLTNETAEKRRKWILLAEEYEASIDAIVLDTSISTCHQRITNIYTKLHGDNVHALELAQPHFNRLRRIAAQYTKPAPVEFAGRVIYLPEGVQSSGYWSAEKLRRFLPDVVSQPLSRILNSSTQGFDVEGGDQALESITGEEALAEAARVSNLPMGTSVESLTPDSFTGQVVRTKRYGSLSSNLNALPLLDTSQELPQRRCSPSAVAIRASPRRKKRTHERKLTVAIKVTDLAAKASPPKFSEEAESLMGLRQGSTEGQGSDDSINELILECPTSPQRTRAEIVHELDTRKAFVGIMDHGNSPPQATKRVTITPSSIPTTFSPVRSKSAKEKPSVRVHQTNSSMPSSVRKKEHEDFPFASEHTFEPPVPPLHKFGDYAEENSGWRDTTSESQLPSPRDKEYQAFGSSPTMLGFASNFMQNMSRQKHSDQSIEKETVQSPPAHGTAQRHANTNEYDDFSAQFNSKNRFPVHELDGCSLNESNLLDKLVSEGFFGYNSSKFMADHSPKCLPRQCETPSHEILQKHLEKHDFAYSTSIQLEQSNKTSLRRARTFHKSSLAIKDRIDKKTLKELPNDTAGHGVDGVGPTKLERTKTVG